MEKFRIGMYGMAQVMAIVYGAIASALVVKFGRDALDHGYPPTSAYDRALFYREYGYLFLLLVLLWAGIAAYRDLDEDTITFTGLFLTLLYLALGTYMTIGLPFL